MTDEEHTFNYDDLNLDFLEPSPPIKEEIQEPVTAATYTPSFRANSCKAKDLAERVAQTDVLVNKIELLKRENVDVQQKLRDFQKSANQIHKLYENEKKKCMDLQIQFKTVEFKSNDLQEHCARLENEVVEKQMQFEQLEAQLDNTKGPLSYTELAIKYLKLVQKLNEDDTLKLYNIPLLDDLSNFCEQRGMKVPLIKVKSKSKRKYKKDKDIQCNILNASDTVISRQVHAQSTQTTIIQSNQMQSQTVAPSARDMQTQTEKNLTKNTQNQAVQARLIEVRSQGTQHISTTTTRGTSTSCFIKKHNVSTNFPEPKVVPLETALVDKFFELWKVSPLSPISDPIPETPLNEFELSEPSLMVPLPDTTKTIGTCTYLCNVQRQIDYIPIMEPIKRSQSSSPSPFIYDNVKYEVNATPTSTPPPTAPLSIPQLNENEKTTIGPTNNNLSNISNLQPMISALTNLPEMHPEVFSTVWQMAGQMFMGLLYSPTSNHLRAQQFNRSGNSHNLQQFHNWIHSLYESGQNSQQQTASSLPNQCEQQINRRENTFDINRVINTNVTQSSDVSTQIEGKQNFLLYIKKYLNLYISGTPREEVPYVGRSIATSDLGNNNIGTNGSTHAHIGCDSYEKWIFKEPLEIPKRSVKQIRGQKIATEKPICTRKRKDKRKRKKRYKAKKAKIVAGSIINNEPDSKSHEGKVSVDRNEQQFVTAVEFCANLCTFNQDLHIENDQNGVMTKSIYSAHLQDDYGNDSVNVEHTGDEKLSKTINYLDISAGNHLRLLQGKSSENMVMVEHIRVPELSDSEKSKCDNVENIEARCLIENQPKICENRIEHKGNLAFKIFGSDSDEDDNDIDIVNTNNSTKSYNNIFITNGVSTEISALFKKSEERILCKESLEDDRLKENQNIEMIPNFSESRHNQGELREKEDESSSEKFTVPFKEINIETDFSKVHEEVHKFDLPNILSPKTSELTKGTENPEVVDTYIDQFSMKASESQQNEAISLTSSTSIQPLYNSQTGNEDVDEPKLVIVEESVETICKKRTHSDSSVDYDPTFDDRISQTCSKDPSQSSSSDSDISKLPEGSVVGDLLENASTKQLGNITLSESANDQKVPCKRGRKRKYVMAAVTFCKRSARLRDKEMRDNQFSSDEGLLSPTNDSNDQQNLSDQSNKDDFCKGNELNLPNITKLCQAKEKILHPSTKEHINNQFQIYTELKQRANKDENYDAPTVSEMQVSTNDTFENTNAIADTSNAVVNKPSSTFFRPFEEFMTVTGDPSIYCSEPFTVKQQNVSTLVGTLASSSHASFEINVQNPQLDSTINQLDLESPGSPPPETLNENTLANMQQCREIPLEINRTYYHSSERKSELQNVINKYSFDIYATVTGKRKENDVESKIAVKIEEFLNTTRDRVNVTASTLAASLLEQLEDCEILANVILDQVCKAPRPEIELNCELASVPSKYIGTHLRLISIVLRHLQQKRPEIIAAIFQKIENRLFNYQRNEKLPLSILLNLTQLYLVVIPLYNGEHNPARLFIAKCLYYHNKMASPMIYEVLCWYPTTLPHRDESNYDKSDALITVIQHLLMTTTYDMDSKDLRHRELLSLLRFEYHFEPFKPKALEVLSNLVTKLKNGNLKNLMYAFAIFCKRNPKLVDILLQQQLLPLADEYYKRVQHTNEYDERVAVLLDCISAVVKPLCLTTDVSVYFSIFERFLGVVQRPVVQEAAVLAILRFQRFGQKRCFHALAHFKPHYPLQMLTTNALKTFIHRKPLKYWNGLMQMVAS